jgi:endonuclease G
MAVMQSTQRRGRSNTWLLAAIGIVILLLVLLVTCRSQRVQPVPSTPVNKNDTTVAAAGPSANSTSAKRLAVLDRLEIPAPANGLMIQRAGYTLSYNEGAEQADWVAYMLTKAAIDAVNVPRTNRFLIDPKVTTGSADDRDYEGSGYDRGHLAPAEDLSYSAPTMRESFYYSNISPQLPPFNRGVWKRIEELVRFWATTYDSLYVVTGPVLTPALPVIGPNGVAVPASYYKVVLQYSSSGIKGMGFLIPHASSSATLKSFAVSIDEVERATGINFFPSLPDAEEVAIESGVRPDAWRWSKKQ